jgi:AraC-like DNA-binding protein
MKIVDGTNKAHRPYAPHLVVREVSLAPGKEWSPQMPGWSLIQVASGAGYWRQGTASVELEAGAVLLVAGTVAGSLLASRLNGVSLNFSTMMPERLAGLITQGEQDFFKLAARKESAYRILPPAHPLAVKARELYGRQSREGLLFRLALLHLLAEIFGADLEPVVAYGTQTDVRDRLRAFLSETPPAALLEISFDELAQITHCTPRHLSRVFYELVGMSFRDKRAEIRLVRARELLATSESKVVDVAFRSGYKSLSLFNRMFTRRFGVSPGKWRQKNGRLGDTSSQRLARPRLAGNSVRLRVS